MKTAPYSSADVSMICIVLISYEFVIVAYIVLFLKQFGCHYHADGTGREVVKRAPDARVDQQPLIGMIKKVGLFLRAVVQSDVETAAYGGDELKAFLVRMPPAAFSAGNIVDPVNASYAERKVLVLLGNGKVAAPVYNLREVYNLAFVFINILF